MRRLPPRDSSKIRVNPDQAQRGEAVSQTGGSRWTGRGRIKTKVSKPTLTIAALAIRLAEYLKGI